MHSIKKIILFVLDLTLILGGISLSLWGFFMWAKIGFKIVPQWYVGNRDADFFLLSIVIGLSISMFGHFHLKFRKCRDKTIDQNRA
jgi:hypothetical protein